MTLRDWAKKALAMRTTKANFPITPAIEREFLLNSITAVIAAAVAEEREQCAKVLDAEVEDHDRTQDECKRLKFCECYGVGSIRRLAAAIRARSEKP